MGWFTGPHTSHTSLISSPWVLRGFSGTLSLLLLDKQFDGATLCRMVTVAQLVDAADLKDNSKAKVKTALAQLGYDQGEEVGEAFRKLTCDQLQRDGGLNVREANAVLAQITPASGSALSW